MKLKDRIHLSVFLFVVIGIISCSPFGGGFSGDFANQSQANWQGDTISYTYDGSQVQYELPDDVRIMKLTINQPVDIFMVKMNNSPTLIPQRSSRYIVSTSQASAAAGWNRALADSPILSNANSTRSVELIQEPSFVRKDFIPASSFVPPALRLDTGSVGRSVAGRLSLQRVSGEPTRSVAPITPKEGQTKKDIWVDLPKKTGTDSVVDSATVDLTSYTKRPATLRAVGTYCYVWVLDTYFATNASGERIDSTKAKDIATQFDKMYPKVRDVFGYESNKMIDYNGRRVVFPEISSVSNTGSKINIVVYDIEGDYTNRQNSGTVGYFWAKDYYTTAYATASGEAAIKLTNEGKYFYVDSGFLNSNVNLVYSTLAHEFQHMINFGEKTMASMEKSTYPAQIKVSSTWSNEMMSMICEDMIQQWLGIPDYESPISRLPWFCQDYYRSGLTDWLSDDVHISYASAYAFGAYLARNYGGTALIKNIATNDYVDQEAITQALSGTGETFETVFKNYAQALVLDNPPPTAKVLSFNKSVPGIEKDMKPINIFKTVVQDSLGQTQYLRPKLLSSDANGRKDLRPYGFTLHSVGYTQNAGEITLTFSSPIEDHEKVYILVQPRSSMR